MKSILKVLLNFLSFGVPLFKQVLSKSRKFNDVASANVHVKLNMELRMIEIEFKTGDIIYLEINSC